MAKKPASASYNDIERFFLSELHKWAIPVLRYALAIVFLWFGLLKVLDMTPVTELVSQTYSFLPTAPFIFILGVWECLIGLGLLFKKCLRPTLILLWLQMLGTLFTFVLEPSIFFTHSNPFLLTVEGEFVIKNLVLIAASLVIAAYEVKPGEGKVVGVVK